MKHKLLKMFFWLLLPAFSFAQSEVADTDYRNFPIIVSLQFHNFALPFHDLGSNFMHVGISLGTEVSFNGKQNWVQQFQAGYYLNKEMGNGFFTYTQTVFRPTVFSNFYPEIKAGIGWQRTFHPVDAYKFEDGSYVPTPGGKSQLIVPLGVSVGYNKYSEQTYLSPFVSFQVVPSLFYNDGIPLSFYSLFPFYRSLSSPQ